MSDDLGIPSASRQAALLIHGLPGAARQEVLARLSADERGMVVPLLAELAALGIPRQLPSSPKPLSGGPIDVQHMLARASAEQVAAAMRTCRAVTVARLLDLADWPWAAAVLHAMDPHRRARIVALRGVRVAPAVSRSLMTSLASALGALPRHPGGQPAGWRRIWPWTR